MTTIVTIRAGVQFTPDAANAFTRADAQVRREFGRGIDVNSTYRSWDKQMLMFVNWNKYVAGKGPYPGHSKAVHPSESFHVSGLALDSDDWRIPRIVQILAENGFIRNRLYVPNEQHHFEYIRSRDKNYSKPSGKPSEKPEPIPVIVPEEEDDDMYKPTVHVRTEGATEYTLAHPEIGQGLTQYTGPGKGSKRTSGNVTTYRGFMVTADETIGLAWARMYARGGGNETSRTDRAAYIAIQVEASRVAAEIG